MTTGTACAVALSLAAHAALLGGGYALSRAGTPGAGKPAELIVQAPLGDVFVSEEQGEHATGPSAPAPAAPPEGPGDSPATGAGAAAPGVPDGEASPVGEIRPVYPPLSRRLGEEGEVVYWIDVAADGTVSGLRLDRSSGYARLDDAAAEALRAARFQAATKAGSSVASTRRFHVEFRLSSRR